MSLMNDICNQLRTYSPGRVLAAQRVLRGRTQVSVAEELGCARVTLSRIENDAAPPELPVAVAIQRLFGIPTDAWLPAPETRNASAAATAEAS